MIFKKLGAPMSLWEDVSKRSIKYKYSECSRRWGGFNAQFFSIGSLFVPSQERPTPLSLQALPSALVYPIVL
ncbi:MAG: PriCT-2 domain-containing protein [Candidatus Fonsibacter sp.]